MTPRLASKIAIITGSSSGIGRAIALAFSRSGATILCSDLDPQPRGLQPEKSDLPTHELILQEGGKAVFQKCDTSNAEEVKDLVARAVKEWGRVDM
jgi:NAD(P)-dependent dehydrogenase (short-subunit alcohol dehydrogenase family)